MIGKRWRHRCLPSRGKNCEAIRRALVRSPPLAPASPSSHHAKASVAISELEIGRLRRLSPSMLVVGGCVTLAAGRGVWCGVGFPAFGGRLVLWLFSGGSRSGVRAGRSCHRRPPPVIQGSWRLLFAGPHCWVCVQRRQTERERDPPERKKKERKKERKKSAGDRRRGPRTGRFELRTKVVPMSACHGGAHGQGTSNSRPVCGLPLVGGRSRVRGGREVTGGDGRCREVTGGDGR